VPQDTSTSRIHECLLPLSRGAMVETVRANPRLTDATIFLYELLTARERCNLENLGRETAKGSLA